VGVSCRVSVDGWPVVDIRGGWMALIDATLGRL
jgi:hypothetical protein